MKMNKLAAGALALALGLGAVAPAVAEEGKTGTDFVSEFYNEKLAEVNKFYAKKKEATAAVEAAKARIAAAEKAVKAAEEAYKNAPGKEEAADIEQLKADVAKLEKEVGEAADAVEAARKALAKAEEDKEDTSKEEQAVVDANAALLAATAKYEAKLGELGVALEKEEEEEEETDGLTPKQKALVELVKSQNELAAANGAYGTAVTTEDAAKTKYEDKYKELAELATTAGAIVAIENDKVVVKPPVEEDKEDDLEALKAAREKAVITLEAVKLLEELTPEKIADVKEELDELVEEQKDLIKKADKYLDKEIALFSTAYAAEDDEEMSAEELTDKLNEKSDKIQDLISDDKEDEEKPAEDDKEDDEKPAEDDKEDDEKPAEDDKEDEEKPAENKPSKGAGNNAKTGIAGVAGVAGILAAASVAYATSKRD